MYGRESWEWIPKSVLVFQISEVGSSFLRLPRSTPGSGGRLQSGRETKVRIPSVQRKSEK